MVKKKDYSAGLPDPTPIIDEIISKYPSKVAKKRKKAMVANDPEIDQPVQATFVPFLELSHNEVVPMPAVKG